jgi:hypothetical protein
MAVFCVVAPCSAIEVDRVSVLLSRFVIALMMETSSASETSVCFYQTTGRNNTEDGHLHTRRRES